MSNEAPTTTLPAVPAAALPVAAPPAVRALEILRGGIRLSDLPRVTVPAGGGAMFDLGGEGAPTLTGVLLASIDARALWATRQPKPNTRPVCSALGGGEGRLDHEAENVPFGAGGPCSRCRYNFYGSANLLYEGRAVPAVPPPRGTRGAKACRESQVIYLLLDHDRLPTVLRVPPTSLTAFRKCCVSLVQRNDFSWQRRITVGLEKATGAGGAYSRLTFRTCAELDAAEQSQIAPLAEHVQAAVREAAARFDEILTDEAYDDAADAAAEIDPDNADAGGEG